MRMDASAGFLGIGLAAVVLGSIMVLLGPPTDPHLPSRGGFLIVAASWFFLSLLGAVPFVLIGKLDIGIRHIRNRFRIYDDRRHGDRRP